MIPQEEWLHEAERVPLGQSRRVYHGIEKRPNMTVYNNGDSWSCYCHACHAWGRVRKEHPVLLPEQPTGFRALRVPGDLTPITEAPLHLQRQALLYLGKRGLDVNTSLAGLSVTVSPSEQRLVLPCRGGYAGRALGQQKAKAVMYSTTGQVPPYAMHPDDELSWGCDVVVTEDYLSALKVRWALRLAGSAAVVVSAQGTHLTAAHVRACLNVRTVVLFLDGDDAGYTAAPDMAKRLAPLVHKVHTRFPPPGLDPKHLTAKQIQDLLLEVLHAEVH